MPVANPVWHCQHLWEQYEFSMDTSYLRQTAYPIIKEAVQFWLENLTEYAGHMIGPGKKVALFGVFTAVHDTEMAEKRMQSQLCRKNF